MKRSLYTSEKSLSSRKKSSKSINSLEELPNELFYEIFQYLDGCEIYQSFDKLNSRFQSLLSSSSFLLQIELDFDRHSQLIHHCHHVILPNKDRLLSLHLHNSFLTKYLFLDCRLDVTFDRLESIFLRGLTIPQSLLVLSYFQCFPRLHSLSMKIEVQLYNNLQSVYEMVFRLPVLKYYKLQYNPEEVFLLPRLVTFNAQWSTIEYLAIGYQCTANQLLFILSHTPQLRRLTCKYLENSDDDLLGQVTLRLSQLTTISIGMLGMMVDEFRVLINKLCAPVEVLIIKHFFEEIFPYADGWEQLIKNDFPQLHQFHLTLTKELGDYPRYICVHKIIDEFRSPFWISWQRYFDVKIIGDQVFCTVHLARGIEKSLDNLSKNFSKHTWSELYSSTEITRYLNSHFHDTSIDQAAIEHLPSIHLIINSISSSELFDGYIPAFKIIFSNVQCTDLNINCEYISSGTLLGILCLLPHLRSLKVSNFPFIRSDWFKDSHKKTRLSISTHCKISKVNVDKVVHTDQVDFLLRLCPQMRYFQMELSKTIAVDKLFQMIAFKFKKCTPHLSSLCLTSIHADDKLVHQLDTMIKQEKLLTNYFIKRLASHIFLKWDAQ